jgi:lipopolysaccharide biosynthesis glycosyltransferase
MYETVTKVMKQLPEYDYEYIFIDNCSTDHTRDILRKIAREDKRVKVIFNLRNFGPSRSGSYGFFQTSGDCSICFACDFQDPPELIPEYDKLLYSDVDVVIREDLGKFYDMELGDNYFAGVDTCSRLRPGFRKYITEKAGLDPQKGYFYSGNLVINSAKLLSDNKLNEFRELGKHDYLYQDMDIINRACNGRILPLGPSYCMTVQLYDLIVDRRNEMEEIYGAPEIDRALNCGIVHYNGAKPWKEACPNMDIWWNWYRRSIFFDEAFARDFWVGMRDSLEHLSLMKRIKLLLRYPLDRRQK